MEVGEKWYVVLKDTTTVSTAAIVDITKETICIDIKSGSSFSGWNRVRYKKDDIEFVERIEPQKEKSF